MTDGLRTQNSLYRLQLHTVEGFLNPVLENLTGQRSAINFIFTKISCHYYLKLMVTVVMMQLQLFIVPWNMQVLVIRT